ncbi:MAG TPA: hypothetical protein VGY77_11280 [Gemmataceae bacterium]|jgi:hypothetical protein|nr:hypothetical protein [Gemmataceae bacterium]
MKRRSVLQPPTDNPQIQAVLLVLRQAWDFATERNLDTWVFAVPLHSFMSAGINETELRWLVDSDYIEHRLERTRSKDDDRVFQRARNLRFSKASCFVLTKKGRDVTLQNDDSMNLRAKDANLSNYNRRIAKANRPFWDEKSHTLFWQGKPLKHFKADAPYQEAVLRAFQAKHWQRYVAISLPDDLKVNSKERLHNAIKRLNGTLRAYLRFHQEGSGARVSWEGLKP